jgi:hypothetical protein
MKYLVTFAKEHTPFYTNWFDGENHFDNSLGMVVYNLFNHTYTIDGHNWLPIIEDNL